VDFSHPEHHRTPFHRSTCCESSRVSYLTIKTLRHYLDAGACSNARRADTDDQQ
jgi:hypothetical protein